MVQYYRDLWARGIEMLAPLTSLVGECGHTKVTKALMNEKVHWHWDEVHQKEKHSMTERPSLQEMWLWTTLTTPRKLRFTLMPHHTKWVQ
jgi:hypothetical protein